MSETVRHSAGPAGKTLSEREMALLGNIFRLILKEITSAEDIELLAPGEMGIDYRSGSLYIRNPHNGKLFSPNSMELVAILAEKLEPVTNRFSADMINGITFYKELADLDPLPGIKFTPDSVIRQMRSPSIFMGTIAYENYEALGWPKRNGMCIAYKYSEEAVNIRYFDIIDYIVYDGRYNSKTHLFEGWTAVSGGSNFSATSLSGGEVLRIDIGDEYKDLSTVTVHLEHDLNPGFSLSVNNEDPVPVRLDNGSETEFPIFSNMDIMLMYDKELGNWTLFDASESATSASLRVMNRRMDETYRKYHQETEDAAAAFKTYVQREFEDVRAAAEETASAFISEMEAMKARARESYEELIEITAKNRELILTRPGNIVAIPYMFTASDDGVSAVRLPDDFDDNDKLLVNYGQTILREDLDYEITGNVVRLKNFTLYKNDAVQFIILKQD